MMKEFSSVVIGTPPRIRESEAACVQSRANGLIPLAPGFYSRGSHMDRGPPPAELRFASGRGGHCLKNLLLAQTPSLYLVCFLPQALFPGS